MQPNHQRVHIDAALTNISVAFMQGEADYIANRVFPIIPVEKASDYYYVFGKEAWFTDEAKPRAVGSEANSGGYEISSDRYSTVEYAFRHPVYDRVRQNADNQIDVDKNGMKLCTRKGLIKSERLFVNSFFKTGVWSTDIAGVASGATPGTSVIHWSDYSSGSPIKNVDNARETVLKATGYLPNTMVIGFEGFNVLKEHPIVLDKIKYTQKGVVTEDLLAQIFGVDRFFVAKSVVNTAAKGQTMTGAFNFGKSVWLGYVNPDPSPEMPSAGYTFAWTGVSEGLGEEVGVRRYREEAKRCDWFEMEMALDLKKVAAELGYFFSEIFA
ncbi:MAG: hypothetical protein WA584_23400 [Pyrinomonadaceae bacterium]